MKFPFNASFGRPCLSAGAFLAVALLACAVPSGRAALSPAAAGDLAYASAWRQDQAHPEFTAFNAWAQRFVASPSITARSEMLSEGVQLAKQRHAAFAKLIQTDPARALRVTLPASVLAKLPPQVLAEVETRVAGVGDYSVLAALQARGGPSVQPLSRFVHLNGQTYRAFVYGRRVSQTSKKGISLHGVALDGMLALSDTALRELEPGEAPGVGQSVLTYNPAAQQPAPVLAQMDGTVYRFGSAKELRIAEQQLEANETGLSPYPQRSPAAVLSSPPTSSIQPSGGTSKGPTTPWTIGGKNILVIRVDFSDLPGDPAQPFLAGPATAAWCQNVADNEVGPYYRGSSYGQTWMTNTITTQLYRMPQPATFYASAGANDQLHSDAEALASTNYTLANYDRIIVVFAFLGGLPNSLITYGGLANVGGPQVWVNGEFDFRVVAHELGHTYGLFHAGYYQVTDGNPISPNGTTVEYGDDFDTMGANYANDHATDFNPYYKNNLGWLADSQVRDITANGVYRLYAFDWTNAASAMQDPILALRLTRDSERTYWIGVRRNFIANPFMQNGIYVIWGLNTLGAGGGGGYLSDLLDMNTPGLAPFGGVNADYDSALQMDQTFFDPADRLLVTPLTSGGTTNPYVDVQVGPGGPGGGGLLQLEVSTNFVTGGNGNGIAEANECDTLLLILTNMGALAATNIQVTLATVTPGVVVSQPLATYPDLLPTATGTNSVPFQISVAPTFVCGTPIDLVLSIKSDQGSLITQCSLPTGVPGLPVRFDSTAPVFIPDVGQTNSPILVTNVDFAITKLTVSMFIRHTFDSDLVLQLISPDGTTNLLSANNGFDGQNYGLACAPDSYRTIFDDDSTNLISNGIAPFLGSYKPQQALATFSGKSGTNVNGVWQLLVADTAPLDVGTIECWSLFFTPSTCTNGGGECPGSDLGLGIRAQPEPALVGSTLTYTISVTNNGPSTAKTVSVSQTLPASVAFVSGSSSQGSVVQSGGVVTANLGQMAASGTASVSVVVLPASPGLVSSTATASSEQPDPNLANNSATVFSHINPPTADLAIGLQAAPASLTIGGTVTYTVSVTNNGPSAAPSGVMATNIFPPGVALLGATISQGSLYITNVNTVICSFGGLAPGGRASATITARPTATGTLIANSTIASVNPNLVDPITVNNSSTAAISVGPAADLALAVAAYPNPDVVTSNLTLITTVTNFGPSAATAVVVAEALPTALTNISVTVSPASTFSLNGTNLTVNLGNMSPGATATITVTGGTIKQGYLSCAATVAATEADPNLANNSGSVSITVALPYVTIASAGASLLSPSTGYLDIGQTNVVQFRLQNLGNVLNTNLVATLLSNATVTPLTGPQSYGLLRPVGVPGGVPVSRNFTFVSNGTNGGTVTATLSLVDGNNTNLPAVSFSFSLPSVTSFSNTAYITIPDPNNMPTLGSGPALPYPSTIAVAGLTAQVARVTATFAGLTHGYPHDINALLVGPAGGDTLLLSHAADASSVAGVTLTFDDKASAPLPATGYITPGTWQPSAYDPSPVFSNPAPAGPYTATLATFGGQNPNGTWSLFVYDDSTGDTGSISNGWSLNFITVTPVNQIADLGLTGGASVGTALAGDLLTYTFTVTNAGPADATGVTFSNTLPAAVVLLGASSSQGNCNTNANTVIGNLANLPAGATATVTVLVEVTPAAVGLLANTAYVSAFETDLHTTDNHATVTTTVNLPVADLALGFTAGAGRVTVGSNLVYSLSVTNHGPGNALSAVASAPLSPNFRFVSGTASPGVLTTNAGLVVASFGTLAPNATASASFTVTAVLAGSVTNTASATSTSTDPALANNTVSTVVAVLNPGPLVIPAGAGLVSEGFIPANGVIDPGEQVTVSLNLANIGVLNTANLVATLLPTNGVTQPGPAATYGQLLAGGPAVAQTFTFRAGGSVSGNIPVTLHLTDGAQDLGLVVFNFALPGLVTVANTNAIIIPDHGLGSPYPSIINVSGLTGLVTKVSVNVSGFTHSFPNDVNLLLVNPANANTLLMSHEGGSYSVTNLTLSFDDFAASPLSLKGPLASGTYRPSSAAPAVVFPAPAAAAPYGSTLATQADINPNGPWLLYVLDDSAGDSGIISYGWSLNLATLNPTTPLADLAVGMMVSPTNVFAGQNLTYTLSVTNLGPGAAAGVVLSDPLPQGFALVSTYTASGSVSNSAGTVVWAIGSLPSSASANLTLTASPTVGGNFLNVASVFGDITDLNPGNNSAQVAAAVSSAVQATLSGLFTNGIFQLTIQGQPGFTYQIQASTNLNSWVALGSYTATNGTIILLDNSSTNSPTRYYRTLQQ